MVFGGVSNHDVSLGNPQECSPDTKNCTRRDNKSGILGIYAILSETEASGAQVQHTVIAQKSTRVERICPPANEQTTARPKPVKDRRYNGQGSSSGSGQQCYSSIRRSDEMSGLRQRSATRCVHSWIKLSTSANTGDRVVHSFTDLADIGESTNGTHRDNRNRLS